MEPDPDPDRHSPPGRPISPSADSSSAAASAQLVPASTPAPTAATRECSWCASPIVIARRPGRPRLYCTNACRQRAYEHRHGFRHRRTVKLLPGQVSGRPLLTGTGYERGVRRLVTGKVHALRTSVHPEGVRRQTVCGVLAAAAPPGRHFNPAELRACRSCVKITRSTPLSRGIDPSNELSRLRALIDEVVERRLDADAALAWLARYAPESSP